MLELDLSYDGLGYRSGIQEYIVDSHPERLFLQSHSACGVTLGVSVDKKNTSFRSGKTRSEVNCGRGLTYTTFLVCNRNDPGHGILC